MAVCRTYHRPTYFSQLLKRSHTKQKANSFTKNTEVSGGGGGLRGGGRESEERASMQGKKKKKTRQKE